MKTTGTLVFALGLLLSTRSVATSGSLELVLTADKSECVLREPVCLRAELRNNATVPVPVIEITRLGSNMEFTLLEVVTPTGDDEVRVSRWAHFFSIKNPNYRGEPLAPGTGILFSVYPTITSPMGDGESAPETFGRAGTYKVRVVYEVPPELAWLSENAPARVVSNEIVLTFREPAALEKSLLDTYWGDKTDWLVRAETLPKPYADIAGLEAAIAQHPDHTLTPYLRLRLANALSLLYVKRQADAIAVLNDLRSRHDDFRVPEVSILLATNLRRLRRDREARLILEQAIRKMPGLEANYEFMREYLLCKYGHTPGQESPVSMWKRNRLMGTPEPEMLEMNADSSEAKH